MPLQARPSTLTLLIAIPIVIVFLFLVFVPDTHQQPSMRHHQRRFDVAPRQLENTTTSSVAPMEATSEIDTSTLPSSSSFESAPPSSSSSASSFFSSPVTSEHPSSSISSSSTSALSSSQSEPLESFAPSSRFTETSLTSSSSRTTNSPSREPRPTFKSSDPISRPTTDPIPGTTLVLDGPSSMITAVQTLTFTPSSTSGALSATGNGFWANKGAVAGTFTVVGLVIVAAIIALFAFARRRSKNHRSLGDNDFFENFAAESPMAQRVSRRALSPDTGGLSSPGPSVAELSEHNPMDPHAANYDQTYMPPYYDISYASQGLTSVQEHGPAPPHSSLTPPVFRRPVVARNSYQPSIDSFYGAT